jgi:hypothetical protein
MKKFKHFCNEGIVFFDANDMCKAMLSDMIELKGKIEQVDANAGEADLASISIELDNLIGKYKAARVQSVK